MRRQRYKKALGPGARARQGRALTAGQAAGLLGSAELNGRQRTARAAIQQFERAQKLGYRSSTMYLDMGTGVLHVQRPR